MNWDSISNSPGLFSLLKILPNTAPILILLALAAGLFLWGQWQDKQTARACATLASPVGLFYSLLALMDCAPAWLLTPASLLAAGLSLATFSFLPFLALPLLVLSWQQLPRLRREGRLPQESPFKFESLAHQCVDEAELTVDFAANHDVIPGSCFDALVWHKG